MKSVLKRAALTSAAALATAAAAHAAPIDVKITGAVTGISGVADEFTPFAIGDAFEIWFSYDDGIAPEALPHPSESANTYTLENISYAVGGYEAISPGAIALVVDVTSPAGQDFVTLSSDDSTIQPTSFPTGLIPVGFFAVLQGAYDAFSDTALPPARFDLGSYAAAESAAYFDFIEPAYGDFRVFAEVASSTATPVAVTDIAEPGVLVLLGAGLLGLGGAIARRRVAS